MEWMSGWASQQARELGHHWFGGEHLLLALSREPSIARDVLGELGVTHARLRAALVGLEGAAAQEQPPHGGTVPSVSFHDLAGCAVGLAAGLGADQVRPEHVLLAVAWRPDRLAAHLLRSLGVDVQRLPAALADKGVPCPRCRRHPHPGKSPGVHRWTCRSRSSANSPTGWSLSACLPARPLGSTTMARTVPGWSPSRGRPGGRGTGRARGVRRPARPGLTPPAHLTLSRAPGG
jgi:hypothetical protein